MKLLIASDAWHPQINGVAHTFGNTIEILQAMGHHVDIIAPHLFTTMPCPTYPEIPLALWPGKKISHLLDTLQPDAIHIATEGPVGIATRRACVRKNLQFTTSFHTKFPEYIEARFRIPASVIYRMVRWFHRPAIRVFVTTESVRRELVARGFRNELPIWSRGVDTDLFRPRDKAFLSHPRPIALFVGRVAVEKNLEAFLQLELAGTKVVVGDGPQRRELEKRFPEAVFAGQQTGETLSRYFAAADVFVFPSRTDTFGLVMLEALACGVPVAAYPVPGPIDIIGEHQKIGRVDPDLATAIHHALQCDPEDCRAFALRFSWRSTVEQFLTHLAPVTPGVFSFPETRLYPR